VYAEDNTALLRGFRTGQLSQARGIREPLSWGSTHTRDVLWTWSGSGDAGVLGRNVSGQPMSVGTYCSILVGTV